MKTEDQPTGISFEERIIGKWVKNLVGSLPSDTTGMLGEMYRDHCLESACCLVGHVTTCNTLKQDYAEPLYSDSLVRSIDLFLFVYDDIKTKGVHLECMQKWTYVRDNCCILLQELCMEPIMHEQGETDNTNRQHHGGGNNNTLSSEHIWNFSM